MGFGLDMGLTISIDCFYWVEDDFLLLNFVMRKTHVLGTKTYLLSIILIVCIGKSGCIKLNVLVMETV